MNNLDYKVQQPHKVYQKHTYQTHSICGSLETFTIGLRVCISDGGGGNVDGVGAILKVDVNIVVYCTPKTLKWIKLV